MSGFHAENIPKEMRDLPQWVCFRKYAENPGDHPKKMMISPETGGAARSDDPSTWSNFFIASSLMARKRMDGLAFALTQGIVFIDLDNAVLEGGVSNAAREILHALPKTYAETSCSGKGIHVFCKGTLDEASLKRNDKLGIEMYQSKRFACMTGDLVDGRGELLDYSDRIQEVNKTFIGSRTEREISHYVDVTMDDQDIIDRASSCRSGEKFKRLFAGDTSAYPSHSNADFALCGMLSFWTKDPRQIDSIFRRSGLMREKWDRKIGSTTYGDLTIRNALRGAGWGNPRKAAESDGPEM